MDCLHFCRWLESRDLHDVSEADKAMKHAASCPPCQGRLHFDEHLDGQIFEAMAKEPMPSEMEARIDISLERTAEKAPTYRFRLYGALAAVLAAMVVLVLPFWPSASIPSLDLMGRYVVADHTGHGDDLLVIDHPSNLGRLGDLGIDYGTIRGELPPSFVFVGARICPLGECEALHLVFKDGTRRVSVYLVKTGDVGFSLSGGSRYSISAGQQTVHFWKKGGHIYALVA